MNGKRTVRISEGLLYILFIRSAGLKSANDQLREEIEQKAPGTEALLTEHLSTAEGADASISDDDNYENVD